MSEKTFTGAALEKALRSGALDQPNLTVAGMVKASDQNGHIGFALGGCETWIDVPTTMIESAEVVGQRSCQDHHHPLVSITLKESDDPLAKVLAALMATRTETGSAGSAGSFARFAEMDDVLPRAHTRARHVGPGRRLVDLGGRLGFSCNSLFCACRGDADCNDMFSTSLCSGRSICIDDDCYCIR